MPFVKVTADFGIDKIAEGVYQETSLGLWDQISPANGCQFQFAVNWELFSGESVIDEAVVGDNSSPTTGTWRDHTIEAISSPGEITDTPASPSAPGQLPSIGGGSSVVTSPGSINPQDAGSPSAPGAVNPVAPGVPDQPENYVGTFAQTLPGDRKERARQNIGAVGPINVLVIGQSNIANGRPGGTIVYNPEVKIWTVAENPNASVDEWQSWNLSLDPPQHSHPAQSGIAPAPVPDPDYQKWSHVLANKLQRFTRRPVHIVQAAESGRSIDHWITTANGGSQEWWDWIVQESADAGITRYDYLFFDHGESGTLALANYETAMRALRQQLEDAGYIDDSTVFLSREVTAGLVNSQAAALVFITERNGNGNMIDRDLLTTPEGDTLHIDGESHELVGQYHLDWLLARPDLSGLPNYVTATPTARVSSGGLVLMQTATGFEKIPAIEFLENPYPATPDLVIYGQDYVTGSEELGGGVMTLNAIATEPTVDSATAGLVFGTGDYQFESASALLSQTGNWLVGLRMQITESGVSRRDIFQQYTAGSGERMTFRLMAGVFTFYGQGSGALTIPSSETIAVGEWVTVMVERSGNDIILSVNESDDTGTDAGLLIQQRAFEISPNGNSLRGQLRKFIVYDRAVTSAEKSAVKNWLDSL